MEGLPWVRTYTYQGGKSFDFPATEIETNSYARAHEYFKVLVARGLMTRPTDSKGNRFDHGTKTKLQTQVSFKSSIMLERDTVEACLFRCFLPKYSRERTVFPLRSLPFSVQNFE